MKPWFQGFGTLAVWDFSHFLGLDHFRLCSKQLGLLVWVTLVTLVTFLGILNSLGCWFWPIHSSAHRGKHHGFKPIGLQHLSSPRLPVSELARRPNQNGHRGNAIRAIDMGGFLWCPPVCDPQISVTRSFPPSIFVAADSFMFDFVGPSQWADTHQN